MSNVSSSSNELSFDDHGFAVFHDVDEFEKCCCCLSGKKLDAIHIDHQRLLCKKFLRGWPESHARHPSQLRCLIKRGLPREERPAIWKALLGCEQLKSTSTFSYQECLRAVRLQLVALNISEYALSAQSHDLWDLETTGTESGAVHKPSQISHLIALPTLRQIIVDVDRTFPTHRMFMGDTSAAKEGRASLFRLLCVYSVYNSEVGYCQGMSYIAGMLLMQMSSEEESFWAMMALFEKPKYLSGYFDATLQRIQNHAAIFQKLLLQRYPRLAKHLITLDVNCLMFVTPWFMCLFTSMPCWNSVLAIWDLLLLDGISTIFRVALAILHLDRVRCLGCTEMGQLLPKLLHPPAEIIQMASFIPMVWKISVEKWEIESLQAILTEEAEIPGAKRSRRSLEAAENHAKRFKTDTGNPPPNSLLQRMKNILGRGVLQDTSNIAAPSPPLGLHRVRYDASRGGRSPGPRGTGLKGHQKVVLAHCSPRATIVTRRVQPGPGRLTGVQKRRRPSVGAASSSKEMKAVTGFRPSPSTPGSRSKSKQRGSSPAVFQPPCLFQTPRRSPRTPGRSNQNENASPCHTRSLHRMLKRSAKAEHSFKTFHTPTPLRKTQVRGHLIISPHMRSPEELQPLKTPLARDFSPRVKSSH